MDSLKPAASALTENRTFDEISVGEQASITRTLTKEDVDLFAVVSGDVNPAHLDEAYAERDIFHRIVAHGMWGGALISSVLGTRLPGPGTIYLGQSLRFLHPVSIGDTLTVSVTVTEKRPDKCRVVLDCRCSNQSGVEVIVGTAEVIAPTEKVSRPRIELPDVRLSRHERFRALFVRAVGEPPEPTAVAWPCDETSLAGAIDARKAGLIEPLLVGDERVIRGTAETAGIDLAGARIVEAADPVAAARAAVDLVRRGEVSLLMKGSLHTDVLMHEVVAPQSGLRTERRISHVYLMDVPSYPRPLLITDAAINVAPTLEDKRDIIQNAIDVALAMGIDTPRVAVLSAVETVTPKLASTLDAAALCKMADRGQITGGIVDGPLGFDNAVSPTAASGKGIVSEVAGRADILVVPDLEAGNMLAKQLTFLAGADAAGVVVGSRVPVILTSRADAERTRLASCAVAVMLVRARRRPAA